MPIKSSVVLNIKQNRDDFELEPLDLQAPIFKYSYLLKTLNPPNSNPEELSNYRTVTVKCLYKNCELVI